MKLLIIKQYYNNAQIFEFIKDSYIICMKSGKVTHPQFSDIEHRVLFIYSDKTTVELESIEVEKVEKQ